MTKRAGFGPSRRPLRQLGTILFDRPMRLSEGAALAAALLLSGTLYCVLYCAVAYPPMHGHVMPLGYSISWAVFTFLPWLLALEIAKRSFAAGCTGGRLIGLSIATVIGAAGLSILIERLADLPFGVTTRPLSFQAADQLAPFVVTAIIAGWARLRMSGGAARSSLAEPDREMELLPPLDAIDWIAAAGNYVEIRSGTTLLMRRLTMNEAERQLDPKRFVRIHRSTIVNRQRITRVEPGRAVHLADGTKLRIGHIYRHSLAAD